MHDTSRVLSWLRNQRSVIFFLGGGVTFVYLFLSTIFNFSPLLFEGVTSGSFKGAGAHDSDKVGCKTQICNPRVLDPG